MAADPAGRRLHLWTALIILGVFLAGGVTGAGLATWLRPRPLMPHPARRPGQLPPPLAELGLSPEQERQAQAVLERRRAEIEATIQESFPKVRALQERMDQELRALLTEQQARRFDEQLARRPPFAGLPRGLGGRGGPGGPGGPPEPGGPPPGMAGPPGAPPPGEPPPEPAPGRRP